jgi:hypothetical protein
VLRNKRSARQDLRLAFVRHLLEGVLQATRSSYGTLRARSVRPGCS